MPSRRSRIRRTVALIATVTVAGGGVVLTAPALVNAAPMDCAAAFNLFIPGTWETDENADPSRPVGMLAPIAEAITAQNGARAQIYTLPYMASAFDNGHTYADSKTDAVSKATAYGVGVNWYPWNTVKLSVNYELTSFEGGAATGDRADEKALLSRFAVNF